MYKSAVTAVVAGLRGLEPYRERASYISAGLGVAALAAGFVLEHVDTTYVHVADELIQQSPRLLAAGLSGLLEGILLQGIAARKPLEKAVEESSLE